MSIGAIVRVVYVSFRCFRSFGLMWRRFKVRVKSLRSLRSWFSAFLNLVSVVCRSGDSSRCRLLMSH